MRLRIVKVCKICCKFVLDTFSVARFIEKDEAQLTNA